MSESYPEFEHYPGQAEVNAWLEGIWQAAQETPCQAELLPEQGFSPQFGVRHVRGCGYVRFSPAGRGLFYGYWQPAPSGPAPLLVHTPGYGAEMSVHPDLVMRGFNVLHVNPLGYVTPTGRDETKLRDGNWPVLPDTVLSGGENGYRDWLTDCALAIKWAQAREEVLPDRVSFFGTSQGGAGSLLLGSLYSGRGARCVAADEPLVNLPMTITLAEWGAPFSEMIAGLERPSLGWRGLGFIDALSHVHRLTLPVMLTGGGADVSVPAATVASLFEKLPSTRLYCYLDGQAHGYTQEFIALAAAWFRLYA